MRSGNTNRATQRQRVETEDGSLTPTVRLQEVDAHHDRTLALEAVSLSIDAGTVTAVIGPNGAGKSTLFALISGRLRPTTARASRWRSICRRVLRSSEPTKSCWRSTPAD